MVACSGDKSLTVQNPAPTADIISHDDGSEILEGFAVTLEGVVSDSNHTPDQLTTRWVINGEVICEDIIPDEDGSTFVKRYWIPMKLRFPWKFEMLNKIWFRHHQCCHRRDRGSDG